MQDEVVWGAKEPNSIIVFDDGIDLMLIVLKT